MEMDIFRFRLMFNFLLANIEHQKSAPSIHLQLFIASFWILHNMSYFHSVCLCVVFSLPGSSENWHMLSISALIMGMFYSPCLGPGTTRQTPGLPPPELLWQESLSSVNDKIRNILNLISRDIWKIHSVEVQSKWCDNSNRSVLSPNHIHSYIYFE